MEVYKIDGIGNDFALLSFLHADSEYQKLKAKLTSPEFIKNFCQKAFSKPVDGLVILLPQDKNNPFDFQWKFFNSDASTAEMCGNAARATSWWYYQNEEAKEQLKFLAHDLKIQAHVFGPEDIEVGLVKVKSLGKTTTQNYLYDSGVPHLICYMKDEPQFFSAGQIDDKAGKKWAEKAKALRYPKELGPAGSNVTLVWKNTDRHISAISFERGVENWTLACGTGAMAAAYFAKEHLGMNFPVGVSMPGGDLSIRGTETSSYLRGPAQVIEKKHIDLHDY